MASQFPLYLRACRPFTGASAKLLSITDLLCCPNRSPSTVPWAHRAAHTCKPIAQSYPHIPQLQITGGGCHVTVANLKYILIFIVYFQKNVYFMFSVFFFCRTCYWFVLCYRILQHWQVSSHRDALMQTLKISTLKSQVHYYIIKYVVYCKYKAM